MRQDEGRGEYRPGEEVARGGECGAMVYGLWCRGGVVEGPCEVVRRGGVDGGLDGVLDWALWFETTMKRSPMRLEGTVKRVGRWLNAV
jgi:hypothetical protein